MERLAATRRGRAYIDEKGHMDLAGLFAAIPFPVYGLKGRPLGLRLRSPGSGGSRQGDGPVVINRVHLGYVTGDPSEPESALELEQGPGLARNSKIEGPSMEELSAVESVVRNYVPRELTAGYFQRGDFNKDWNLERLSEAPRQPSTVHVAGRPLEAELWSWDEPLQVVLGRFHVDGQPFRAVTLGLTPTELLETLSTLAPLKEDGDARAEHQRDYDENSRRLWRRHPND